MLMRTAPLFPGESTTSFCSRVAAANRVNMDDFCRDMGLRTRDIIEGKEEAVSELARLTRVDALTLRQHTTSKVAETLVFGTEVFPLKRDYFSRTNMRFCPACMQADAQNESVHPKLRRYGRTIWSVRFYRTCIEHGCTIVDAGHHINPRFNYDFCARLNDMRLAISEAAARSKPRQASPFERFVSERLSGTRGHGDFLDELSLQAGADMCELVGGVIRDGRGRNMKSRSEDDWQQVAQLGFEQLSKGRARWHEVLVELCNSAQLTKSDCGGTAIYGDLHRTLNHGRPGAEYDRIRADMRAAAINNLSLTNNATIFGEKISTNRISTREVQLKYGRRHGLVRKYLMATGSAGSVLGSVNNAVFDDQAVAAAAEELKDLVRGKEVERLLGIGAATWTIMSDLGLLKPAVERNADLSLGARYSRKSIAELLARLMPRHPCVNTEGLYPFASAVRRAFAKQGEVLQLLADHKLERVGIDTKMHGIRGLLLDPIEIAGLTELPHHGCLDFRDLMSSLRTSRNVVGKLIKYGHLKTLTTRNQFTRRSQWVVEPTELVRFQMEYASFDTLMIEHGLTRPRLRELLKQHSVTPALPVDEITASYYRRDEIRFLAEIRSR